MQANKVIITTVLIYITAFVVAAISYSNTKFTGSDAAGNGMAKGLTLFYGIGIFFIVALVLTVINGFFFKGIHTGWIKILFFVPIALPTCVFLFYFFEIGRPRQVPIEKQAHRLSFELRSTLDLGAATFGFRSSGGGSGSRLKIDRTENGLFFYKSNKAIFYEMDRKFSVHSDEFETEDFMLSDIPYQPEVIPYTEWQTIVGVRKDIQDTIKIDFRYKITK